MMKHVNSFLLATSFLLWATILAAPAPELRPAPLQLPGHNLTLPSYITPASQNRPQDPYDYRVRGSRQTIRFFQYDVKIDSFNIEECLVLAYLDLPARRGRVWEYKTALEYSANGVAVRLSAPSGGLMTWTMWEEAIVGILKFSRAEFAGALQFEIMQDGVLGWVGKGSIVKLDATVEEG